MSAPLELSLVIPVYNERDNLPVLVEEIGRALAGRAGGEPYEIVAVDDGSTDGSLDVLKVLKREHPEIHIVALAANAGQSAAFGAGFGAARGRVIVTLDADLQNDPADIPVLVAELERSGAAAVVGYRVGRRDSGWKRLQSRIANGVRNRLNRETIRDTGCSLKAFRAEALRALPLFNGMHRFLPTLVRMQGGQVTEVPVHHRSRRFGKTKYGMWNRVFRALIDALAVRWMRRRAGWGTAVGAGRGRKRSRPHVRHSSRANLIVAALGMSACVGVSAASQAPNYRVTYHLRVVERTAGETRLLASAAVSGPPETDMRLALRTGATERQGLLGTLPEPENVHLAGLVFSRRQLRSSR